RSPAPHTALFPYTTLFRSRREELGAEPAPAVLDAERRLLLVIRRAGKLGAEIALVVVGVVLGHQAPARQAGRRPARAAEQAVDADRKSTRLNSSHVKISYA